MVAANIDAVERYVKRLDEYAEDKLNQTKLYKSTANRIYTVRNMLLRVCDKLDSVLAKFEQQSDSIVHGCESTDTASNTVVCADVQLNDTCDSETNNDNKSLNAKRIIVAYKQMFDAAKHVDHDSEIIQRTIGFLSDWFDTKILGFYKLRKVNPELTYNITWLPNWIRDYIVYIGTNADNIDEAFDKLENFIHADEHDSRYTYMVPYEVADLGRRRDRLTVTDVSSAIWGELFSYVFKHLPLPKEHICYCAESLVDHAYLTDAQIKYFIDTPTPEYYKTVEWVMKFKFKLQ